MMFVRILVVFALGLLAGSLFQDMLANGNLMPSSTGSYERQSPGDWVMESQIHVYDDAVYIGIPFASAARFENTNSMDPLIDEKTTALFIVPKKESDIKVGDIIFYESSYGKISHRVVFTGYDDLGWYAYAKGDNAQSVDSEKIRFSRVKGVIVALVY